MDDEVFGEMTFDTGWYKEGEIRYYGETYPIVICCAAYFESDPVTDEMRENYLLFLDNRRRFEETVERMVAEECAENPERRFTPQMLLFQDEEMALLLDDEDDPDNGLAIILLPNERVETQDAYL